MYREILGIDGKDLSAFSGLERIYEAREMWVELIDILRKRSNVEESPAAKRELFQRVTTLGTKLGGGGVGR